MRYIFEWILLGISVMSIGVTIWADQRAESRHESCMTTIVNIQRSKMRCDSCRCDGPCRCKRSDRCSASCNCGEK